MRATDPSLVELASEVSRSLRAGTLTLGQVLGITERETVAIAEAAECLRRQGDVPAAADVAGLLLTLEPYRACHWRRMAALQRRCGNQAATLACLHVLALLDRPAAEQQREHRELARSPRP